MKIEQIYRHDNWWDNINWSQLERDVRRLQGRIYRLSKFDPITRNAVTLNGEKVRGDAIGTLCSSHMKGNFHVWFQEGKGLVTAPTYSTYHYLFHLVYPPCFKGARGNREVFRGF